MLQHASCNLKQQASTKTTSVAFQCTIPITTGCHQGSGSFYDVFGSWYTSIFMVRLSVAHGEIKNSASSKFESSSCSFTSCLGRCMLEVYM